MPNCGLRFRISGQTYQQIADWQSKTDRAILIHQLSTRGQALVTGGLEQAVSGQTAQPVMKIRDVPEQGKYLPYYGTNGAYRYTFQPMVEGCRLEVFNQMGGFAFYAPERIEPLNLYMFTPVEVLTRDTNALNLTQEDPDPFQHDPETNQIVFTLSGEAYSAFTNWAWSRRALHAYHFIFTPSFDGQCEIKVFARESGVTLSLEG